MVLKASEGSLVLALQLGRRSAEAEDSVRLGVPRAEQAPCLGPAAASRAVGIPRDCWSIGCWASVHVHSDSFASTCPD